MSSVCVSLLPCGSPHVRLEFDEDMKEYQSALIGEFGHSLYKTLGKPHACPHLYDWFYFDVSKDNMKISNFTFNQIQSKAKFKLNISSSATATGTYSSSSSISTSSPTFTLPIHVNSYRFHVHYYPQHHLYRSIVHYNSEYSLRHHICPANALGCPHTLDTKILDSNLKSDKVPAIGFTLGSMVKILKFVYGNSISADDNGLILSSPPTDLHSIKLKEKLLNDNPFYNAYQALLDMDEGNVEFSRGNIMGDVDASGRFHEWQTFSQNRSKQEVSSGNTFLCNAKVKAKFKDSALHYARWSNHVILFSHSLFNMDFPRSLSPHVVP